MDATNFYFQFGTGTGRFGQAMPSSRAPEHHPESVYYLRYLKAGKRVWQNVGCDADAALEVKRFRSQNLPSSQRTEQRWFNTAVYHQDPTTQAFVYDQIGAYKVPGCPDTDPLCLNSAPSDVGRYGNAHASSLLGPRLDVHHLSVFKTFPIGDKVDATFTSEISDIFNHPLFYDPDTHVPAFLLEVAPVGYSV